VFYVDGLSLAVYSDVLLPRGPVGKLGGKILGCRALVVLHDADGHPLLATTHRGDCHLTVGAPQMLHSYEQAIGQAHVQRVVVDREGMAAEFLAQQKLEGRQVITRLQADQYAGKSRLTKWRVHPGATIGASVDLRSGSSALHVETAGAGFACVEVEWP